MSIFVKKIDEITIDDIDSFIAGKHKENIRLEYKEDFSSKDATLQIAKEVSAFANQQGGVIIFGISEQVDRCPDKIVGLDKKQVPRKKIQSVCLDHIYPPLFPEIQECELKNNPDKLAVIVRVAMSDETPHTINKRTGFYIRGEDVCTPRPMTDEEIELLWNRRKKLVERREWLLQRPYNRVFVADKPELNLTTPIILMAIPLFPMKPLVEREKLPDIHKASVVSGSNDFPLFSSDIKTASDSIYCYSPDKNVVAQIKDIAKRKYGEINIFGQISHFEDAVNEFEQRGLKGIFLGYELKKLYFMVRYVSNFYAKVGYWGIIKMILKIQNCIGELLYSPSYTYDSNDKLSRNELDKDVIVEKDFTVGEIVDGVEHIVVDIFRDLLWGTGLNVYRAARVPIAQWLQQTKIGLYGDKVCPKCSKERISTVDAICLKCKAM